MSFKFTIHIGYFHPDTGSLLPLPVDVPSAREAIARAGGRLLEQCTQEDEQRLRIATAMKVQANREVLGFIGNEYVILHKSGFLVTTLDDRSRVEMLAFLQHMCGQLDCEIYHPDGGGIVTKETLQKLSRTR